MLPFVLYIVSRSLLGDTFFSGFSSSNFVKLELDKLAPKSERLNVGLVCVAFRFVQPCRFASGLPTSHPGNRRAASVRLTADYRQNLAVLVAFLWTWCHGNRGSAIGADSARATTFFISQYPDRAIILHLPRPGVLSTRKR